MTKTKKHNKADDLKRIDKDFFEERPIKINMEDEDSFTVYMSPLKVKDIQVLNRVTHLQEKDPDDTQAALMLVSLMVRTLNVTGDELPVEATSGLVGEMIAYNFPKEPEGKKADAKKTNNKEDGLIECFDFLISNGHLYTEILEYTIPVFNNFIVVVAERLGIKKKPLDAGQAFRKLGLPVRPRGEGE